MLKAIIYGTPACSQCTATEKFMEARDLDYDKVDLSVETSIADDLREEGFKSLPVVKVYDGPASIKMSWQGFQPNKIQELMKGSEI